MNRCSRHFLPHPASWRAVLLILLSACLLAPVWAQQNLRVFPKKALRGELLMSAPPLVELNGKAEKLSPGARIRNLDNLIVLPGSLRGQRLVVNYVREMNGQLHEVWILTPKEIQEKRAGASSGRNFVFESETSSAPLSTRP